MTLDSGFTARAMVNLAVRDANGAIDFYKRAFNAVETGRMTTSDGKVAYAEMAIGQTRISLKDEEPGYGDPSPESLGGTSVRMILQVEDVDDVTNQAVQAGATVVFPVAERYYGYRDGRIRDPFGHLWIVQTPRDNGE